MGEQDAKSGRADEGGLQESSAPTFGLLFEAALAPHVIRERVALLPPFERDEALDALEHGALKWSWLMLGWATENGMASVSGEGITIDQVQFLESIAEIQIFVDLEYSAPHQQRGSSGPLRSRSDAPALREGKTQRLHVVSRHAWEPFPVLLGIEETPESNGESEALEEAISEEELPHFGEPSTTLLEGGRVGEVWIRISPTSRSALLDQGEITLRTLAVVTQARAEMLRFLFHTDPSMDGPRLKAFNDDLSERARLVRDIERAAEKVSRAGSATDRRRSMESFFSQYGKVRESYYGPLMRGELDHLFPDEFPRATELREDLELHLSELEVIVAEYPTERGRREKLTRWTQRVRVVLETVGLCQEADRLATVRAPALTDEAGALREFVQILIEELQLHPEDYESAMASPPVQASVVESTVNRVMETTPGLELSMATKTQNRSTSVDTLAALSPTIGVITALSLEFAAFRLLMDDAWETTIDGVGAGRRITMGTIPARGGGRHRVLLHLADAGTNIAAMRASRILDRFPRLPLVMLGIAGGVPNAAKAQAHPRLGDVVVSDRAGIIQFDFQKHGDEIEYRHPPRPPHPQLYEAVRLFEADRQFAPHAWAERLDSIAATLRTTRPADDTDVLLDVSGTTQIEHPNDTERMLGAPRVLFGPIASSNTLLKSAAVRDALRDRFGVLAVEMEASGIADATWQHESGYLAIRGISDYCDILKNDRWQKYAAAAAALYLHELLGATPSLAPTVPPEHGGSNPKQTADPSPDPATHVKRLFSSDAQFTINHDAPDMHIAVTTRVEFEALIDDLTHVRHVVSTGESRGSTMQDFGMTLIDPHRSSPGTVRLLLAKTSEQSNMWHVTFSPSLSAGETGSYSYERHSHGNFQLSLEEFEAARRRGELPYHRTDIWFKHRSQSPCDRLRLEVRFPQGYELRSVRWHVLKNDDIRGSIPAAHRWAFEPTASNGWRIGFEIPRPDQQLSYACAWVPPRIDELVASGLLIEDDAARYRLSLEK